MQVGERVARTIVEKLDGRVWDQLAEKAITKMPKYKLADESEKMFDDFAVLTSNPITGSPGKIIEEKQQLQTFKENLIVGTSKIIGQHKRQQAAASETVHHGRDKKRLASAIELNHNKKVENKGHLFRLTMSNLPNDQQSKIQDTLRTAKYDNIRYNQVLSESQRQRRAESQHHSLVEKKKFKEMKIFTYDYQGKLMSLGSEKTKTGSIHVVNMKPNYGAASKTMRNTFQRTTRQQDILEIINKRIVGNRTPAAQPAKQSDKDKQEKKNVIKNLQPTPNMLQYLKDDNKVSVGVVITDINSKSKFIGGKRDPNEMRNTMHNNFRGEFKQLEQFQDRVRMRKYRIKEQSVRFQHQHQEIAARRLRTEATDRQSKVFTTVSGHSRKRGVIDIKNQRLYTQNFIQDLD